MTTAEATQIVLDNTEDLPDDLELGIYALLMILRSRGELTP